MIMPAWLIAAFYKIQPRMPGPGTGTEAAGP